MQVQGKVKQHKIQQLKISDIRIDPDNPNVMSKEQMEALRQSMRKFGYLDPIIVDQDNLIADGEHRVQIYKEFGEEYIDGYKVTLNDIQRRELRQIQNKLRGEHNREKDSAELLALFQEGHLEEMAQLIAAPLVDLQNLITKYHPDIQFQHEDNFDVEKTLEELVPESALGDMWELGDHRIICADNTDIRSLEKLIGDKKINQLNCDPPYGVEYGAKNKWLNEVDIPKGSKRGGRIETPFANDYKDFNYTDTFNILFKAIPFAEHNTIYIWSGDTHMHEIRLAGMDNEVHWSNYLIWIKNQPSFSLGRLDYEPQHEYCMYGWKGKHKFYGPDRTTLLQYDRPRANDLHPTMKPINLISQTIQDGTQEGDIVLDVFLGSGSTLIACEQTKRICYGVEIDPHYIDVVVKRWEAYTGKKALKR